MPLDPTVPLGITPQVNSAANPLDMVGKFATIQNAVNQNKLFQQTFAARQLAGQIMSSAPDMEAGLQQIMKSPAAPFMGEFATQVRQSRLAELQAEKEKQGMFQSGLSFAQKMALPAGLANPANMDSNFLAGLRGVPASVREQVLAAINDQRAGLYAGLPEDTAKWSQTDFAKYTKNATALAMATGTGADTIHEVVGQGKLLDTGSGFQPLIERGASAGGGAVMAGEEIPKGQAPSWQVGPDGIPRPVSGVRPGGSATVGQISAAGENALGVQGPATPSNVPLSAIGTPIDPPRVAPRPGMDSPFGPTRIGVDRAEGLEKKYNEEGLPKFHAAEQTLGSLHQITYDIDKLAESSKGKDGGFLTSGPPFAEFRFKLAQGLNGFATITGGKPWVKPEDVATVEGWNKESGRMTYIMQKQFFGGNKEAATITQGVGKTVPQFFENTFLGAKFVANGLITSSERERDLGRWMNEWTKKNPNLIGAEEEFNRRFPATAYVDKAIQMTGFGLTRDGFKDEDSIGAAYKAGYLTRDQAKEAVGKWQKEHPEVK